MFGNNCNHHSTLNFVCSLLLLLSSPCNSSILNTKLDADHTTCAIYPLSIHVNKDEFDLAGNLIRNCEDNITVNKCEGTCVSSLQPSVVNPSGFLKVIKRATLRRRERSRNEGNEENFSANRERERERESEGE